MIHRNGIIGFVFCAFFSLLCSSAEETVHIVQNNETVFSIARFFGVDQNELMSFNGITDPSKLRSGQQLRIPGTSGAQGWNGSYRAARGDTLYSIARNHGLSVEALLAGNNLPVSYVLKEGDALRVPGQAAANAAGPGVPSVQQAAAASAVTPGAADAPVRWPVNAVELHYMTGRPGVEITGERGETVRSLTRGMVISAGPFRDYGRVAIIQVEGGYYYVYGGCETLLVKEGDRVIPGTELGRLGIDSASGKALLKFLVYRSSTPIDPAKAPRA